MKALSIRQPWPWAILHLPPDIRKDIENRDWKPSNPAVRAAQHLIQSGETFLIHASKTFDKTEVQTIRTIVRECGRDPDIVPAGYASYLDDDNPYPLGGIVGQARIVGMVYSSKSPWFSGPRGLVLADAKPLPFVPCKGALGFFDVPDEAVQALAIKTAGMAA